MTLAARCVDTDWHVTGITSKVRLTPRLGSDRCRSDASRWRCSAYASIMQVLTLSETISVDSAIGSVKIAADWDDRIVRQASNPASGTVSGAPATRKMHAHALRHHSATATALGARSKR